MISIEEVLRHFRAWNHIVLASVEEDQPRLRPITLMFFNDRFFFATQSSDNKVKQLSENPKIELILQLKEPPDNGYVRVEGKAEKQLDQTLVSQLYEVYDFMEKLWSGPSDPNLTVYEVKPSMYDYLKPGEWSSHMLKVK